MTKTQIAHYLIGKKIYKTETQTEHDLIGEKYKKSEFHVMILFIKKYTKVSSTRWSYCWKICEKWVPRDLTGQKYTKASLCV